MSNKMPVVSVKKIKSAHKLLSVFVALMLLDVAVLVLLGLWAFSSEAPRLSIKRAPSHARVCTSTDCVGLEVASTSNAQQRGLSGRPSLAQDRGMLFAFGAPQQQCMWMKDMKISIDMVWLGSDKRISKIESNVAPATYPDSFCQDSTKYVVELAAGQAQARGLHVGQQLAFSLD